MLIEFKVSNFRSIAEEQTFSMLPTLKSSRTQRTKNSYYSEVLKVAALYGANGSGKTNFVRAISFLTSLVERSGKFNSDEKIDVASHILDPKLQSEPSSFEITFSAWGDVFRYLINADEVGIHKEVLYKRNSQPRSQSREIFFRSKNETRIHSSLSSYENLLVNQTNENQLFLSKLDQNNDSVTKPAFNWLTLFLRNIRQVNSFPTNTTARWIKENNYSEYIGKFLQAASINVQEVVIREKKLEHTNELIELVRVISPPDDPITLPETTDEIIFKLRSRANELIELDFNEESRGTREFFALIGPLIDTLTHGLTLVIDELNASFHTELQKLIIELFLSSETNSKGAQLVFTTHDINLMNVLERDEIWFADKDRFGATQYQSASDFGTVSSGGNRKNEAFAKRYLEGRFGAMPDIDFIDVAKSIISTKSE